MLEIIKERSMVNRIQPTEGARKTVVVVADLEISLSRKKLESDLKVVCWHE